MENFELYLLAAFAAIFVVWAIKNVLKRKAIQDENDAIAKRWEQDYHNQDGPNYDPARIAAEEAQAAAEVAQWLLDNPGKTPEDYPG